MGGNQVETQQRYTNIHGVVKLNIVMELQEMFHLHHKYVRIFQYDLENIKRIKMKEKNHHQRRQTSSCKT